MPDTSFTIDQEGRIRTLPDDDPVGICALTHGMPDMTDAALYYVTSGPFTTFPAEQEDLLRTLPDDPVGICAAAQGLVIQPGDAAAAGLPDDRQAERNIRSMSEVVDLLAARSPEPLHEARPPEHRVVGTCRHFAVLGCAFLRYRGVPARARCGFASYFQPGLYLDHWVIEYRHATEGRWVRIDGEILGQSVLERPDDLVPGQFRTGGEAWTAYRAGEVDGASFGVYGTDHAWGPAELRKVETLPWDEWGRMTASYAGETGAGYDALIDRVAAVSAADDADAIARLYTTEDFAVPDEFLPRERSISS